MVKNYKNSFGELHADAITFVINDRKQTIRLKNLVRIRFVKRQKYHINGIAFLLCFYLLLFLRNHTLSQASQSLIFSVTMILLEIGIFFKSFRYTFILIHKNYFMQIIVVQKMSKDAENFACQINKAVALWS
jgi:hypothetical protein